MSVKYIIYYGDGTTVTDETPPEKCPKQNVQIIVQVDDQYGWHTVMRGDYYVWDWYGPGWCGVDFGGLIDYLTSEGWKTIVVGRTLPSEKFDALFVEAMNTRYLPKEDYFPRNN